MGGSGVVVWKLWLAGKKASILILGNCAIITTSGETSLQSGYPRKAAYSLVPENHLGKRESIWIFYGQHS